MINKKLFGENKIFLVIIFISLLVRFSVAIYSYNGKVWLDFADDKARERFALSIYENGFVPELNGDYTTPETIFAPVVPIIIGTMFKVFGNNWLPIFLLNSIIGSLTCVIFYLIALKYFNKMVALSVLLWTALYPGFIKYLPKAGNEIWIVFFFSLTFYFMLNAIDGKKYLINTVGFAISFVLLFHTDERYISYFVFFALLLLLGNFTALEKLKKILLFIALISFFSVPWLVRNYFLYDDVVLISIRTTNLTSKFLNHRKELVAFDHEPDGAHFSQTQIDSVRKGLLDVYPLLGKPIRKEQLDAMKSGNVPHPFNTYEKIISRLYFLWLPFKFHDNYRIDGFTFVTKWSKLHNAVSILTYGILLPFAVFGLYSLYKNKKYLIANIFLSTLFFHTLIHVAFIPYTRDRYRHPVDFIVIILGIYGLYLIYDFTKEKYFKNKT